MNKISAGLFTQSQKKMSPNYNKRPDNMPVDAIIIHSISLPPGCYKGNDIDDFFINQLDCDKHPFYDDICALKVSAHLLIRRSGELIQYVNLLDRAWHAGQSCLAERENCNDFSIGIELEGTDMSDFTDEQYHTLTDVVSSLMAYFPQISIDRIVGHSDIAPGRKTDPGKGFEWHCWQAMLDDELNK